MKKEKRSPSGTLSESPFAQYKKLLSKQDKAIRIILTAAAEVFSAYTLIQLVSSRNFTHIRMSICAFFLVLVPVAVEILFRCKMKIPAYIAVELYAIGPLLGECYRFYRIIPWWDKLLHCLGGIVFALFGAHLLRIMSKDEPGRAAIAVFALCFSMSVSLFWEFAEYTCDVFFDFDMQVDTVVTELHSIVLADAPGVPGDFAQIDSVTVNGIELPINGYLDIGLHDTMRDMLIETAGAAGAAIFLFVCKNRSLVFMPLKELEESDETGSQ